MKIWLGLGSITMGALAVAASLAIAQRPGGGGGPEANLTKSADAADLVTRMMAFDADKDGKLTKAEVTDDRLTRLFDRADLDKDGTVTKDDLIALAAKETPVGRGGFGGPGGPGGPPPGGPGGPGGRGGPMGRPGEILSAQLQQRLNLSSDQKSKVEALQKEVDAQLAKILDDDQKQMMKEMRDRGPGGPGGPGGRRPGGGPGGPGGPPPRD